MPSVTAACLIIGDEVLNGKITDTNSRFFAQYCYKLGVELKEIATVGDEEGQIVDTLHRLCGKYNIIVTSGGIGPTHDDITYDSIAKSLNLPCKLDKECQEHMRRVSNPEARHSAEALKDYYRMATLPSGDNVHNYYIFDDLWVPVVSINKQVYIFPGIPQLFERLLNGMSPILKEVYSLKDTDDNEYQRYFIKTEMSESQISGFLRQLQERSANVSSSIKIGSYPHFGMGFNTVSILGTKDHKSFLKQITEEAVAKLNGEEISAEMEKEYSDSR